MLLFAINISFGILPGGIIPSYGLLGEVASFATEENQESVIQSNPYKKSLNKRNLNKRNLKKVVIPLTNNKKQKAQYVWLMLIIMILFIYYLHYWYIYSVDKTPVALNVRMNN